MQQDLALTKSEIQELRDAGYTVEQTSDLDGAGYIWRHPASGASQNDTKQPSRRSAAQAWHDCSVYADPDGTDTQRDDWIKP